MRAYIAHDIDCSEELRARLKPVEGEFAATQKVVDEGVELLRKVDEGKEAVEIEAPRLAKEKEEMEASKKKVEEEAKRLRWELQELRAGFVVQKEELKGEYQKPVDDISSSATNAT